jgi:hypothetical protein
VIDADDHTGRATAIERLNMSPEELL